MKRYILKFVTAMAALVLVACSKSDDDSSFLGVKAELDGVELKVSQGGGNTVNTTSSGGSFSIYAYNSDEEGYRISLEDTTPTGTYDLADSEVSMTYVKDAMASNYYGFDSGTMTITKFENGDDIHFKATFSGAASPNMGGGTAVVITDGEVEIKF